MPTRKTTKKSAPKRKTIAHKNSYSVADLRASLQKATAELIAIEVWLDQKLNELAKERQ